MDRDGARAELSRSRSLRSESSAEVSRRSVASDTELANVRVVARFRPPNAMECGIPACVTAIGDTQCTVEINGMEHGFQFDRVFGPEASQDALFEDSLRETVDDVLNGYNGTVLAYGQTGAGKSFTMMGDVSGVNRGAIPRIAEYLFMGVQERSSVEYEITVSYMEVYNERVKDLLDPSKDNLSVHEHKSRPRASRQPSSSAYSGFYVKGLSSVQVTSVEDVYRLLAKGQQHRATGATAMNHQSSRSHTIISLTLARMNRVSCEKRKGRLFLVDLAGSEKAAKTGAVGQVLEEAKNINRSLSTLGMVISALSDSRAGHIPYRNSKLTRILQESLGGNSRTSLIVNCSLSSLHSSETISTLRFGTRAKRVRNRATINTRFDDASLAHQVSHLQEQLDLARAENLMWRSSQYTRPMSMYDCTLTSTPPGGDAMSEHSTLGGLESEASADAYVMQVEPRDGSMVLGNINQKDESQLVPQRDYVRELESRVEEHMVLRGKVDGLKSRLETRNADIGHLETKLQELVQYVVQKQENGMPVMRHSLNALNQMRTELIHQNDKLQHNARIQRQVLRVRSERIVYLENKLVDESRQGRIQNQQFLERLNKLGPRISAATTI